MTDAPRPVLITGLMRSGTSLVAEMVHRLGWQAAVTMGAPIPPAYRSDWEDLGLSLPLVGRERWSAGRLQDYIGRRIDSSRIFGFGGKFALKSPYLVFIWPKLLTALRALDLPDPLVIRTFRREESVARSLAAHPQLYPDDQELIRGRLHRIHQDMVVGYEDAVADPLAAARALASALGVFDPPTVEAAAALVGLPTRYPPCPPSSPPLPSSVARF